MRWMCFVCSRDSLRYEEVLRQTLLPSFPRPFPLHAPRYSILQASMRAMERAVDGLKSRPDAVFVDGPYVPAGLADIGEAVVKGDSKVFSVAAASVIAKVCVVRLGDSGSPPPAPQHHPSR